MERDNPGSVAEAPEAGLTPGADARGALELGARAQDGDHQGGPERAQALPGPSGMVGDAGSQVASDARVGPPARSAAQPTRRSRRAGPKARRHPVRDLARRDDVRSQPRSEEERSDVALTRPTSCASDPGDGCPEAVSATPAIPARRASDENRVTSSAPPPTDPLLRHQSANSRLLQPDTFNPHASHSWNRRQPNRPEENHPDKRDLCLTRPPQHSRGVRAGRVVIRRARLRRPSAQQPTARRACARSPAGSRARLRVRALRRAATRAVRTRGW